MITVAGQVICVTCPRAIQVSACPKLQRFRSSYTHKEQQTKFHFSEDGNQLKSVILREFFQKVIPSKRASIIQFSMMSARLIVLDQYRCR
ncbi:hypothetical protein CEXT_492661 [Caerostris extrusa]|uniref:Uncharacterized protein n=1 Tax=Caerostris extrusa TaxID=172846 RepID=A0AAV4PCJ2_CAEEX|nr:hypothetical protein CEXT_492661 [Caerostris extrusa]